ncbi:uncharacterized protein LOC105229637 [Bactrocera dorsalis]|uniref:Uncharacterized protein LOC105229637 n=1 Tax=Bactrocera dorsalis TaxID=27457 RepID=A0ABM3JTQ4_BACDO|nr:uncharacterized protein LOC105229637 [Bactrocera dorsalis]
MVTSQKKPNIFIGPPVDLRYRDNPRNQRGGDPGNAFEEYANRIIRDDTHFTALQNLNRDMQRYVNNPLDVNLFLQIMQNLDIVNRRTTPFPFDAQDWEIVNGKFFICDRHREKRSQSRKSHRLIAPNTESLTDDDPFDYYVGFCRTVKQELMASHFSSINKKTIKAMDRMTFDCPKNTHIIVKRAIKEGMRNGTEEIKELCDNKRSCVFSKRDTDGLGVDVDYYCANILTSIRKRRELQRLNRRSSSEFELNCPLNYTIRIRKAMSHSAVKETDITPIFREKCDGVNPCKNKLDNWGLQPITVEFSCIPNSSMFV